MSRVRFTKISQPANPPTSTGELYYDTTVNAPCFVDQGGNRSVLGSAGGNNSFRLVGFTMLTSGTSYNSQAHGPVTALYIECIGGGGSGGGANGAAANQAFGSGGGSGGFSSAFVTLAALGYTNNATMVYAVGAGGANNANNNGIAGGNTSFNNGATGGTLFLRAQGGNGGLGPNLSGNATLWVVAGGNGAPVDTTQAAGNNFFQVGGDPGGTAIRVAAGIGWAGQGGSSPIGGGGGAGQAVVTVTTSVPGLNGANYGGGGGGGSSNAATAVTGGNGGGGCIRIWEFVGV